MKTKIALFSLAFLTFGSSTFAEIEIVDPWIPPTTNRNAALYVKIVNTSDQPDKLIGVTTHESVRSELHSHEEENGVMQMKRVGFIEIPANGNKVLESGGHHIMLKQVNRELKAGDSLEVNFIFKHAGNVGYLVPVRAR